MTRNCSLRGKFISHILTPSVLFIAVLVAPDYGAPAQAQTETVLYNFCRQPNCIDGSYPESPLTFDSAGNLYGTTNAGGAVTGNGGGTVFELSPNGSGGWNETVLYSFCSAPNCADGFFPNYSGVIFDRAGNLYGTTTYGGANASGVVFKLSPAGAGTWKETVLYNFCSQSNCSDGNYPSNGVILDSAGNLYGTTSQGGDTSSAGIVFELSPSASGWTERVIYDAGSGFAGLTMDAANNIFGVAESAEYVYELSPNGSGGWNPTVIHTFTGSAPIGTPVLDEAGNVYGTTQVGGANGYGTVYELSPGKNGWTEKILYSFKYGKDGAYPTAGIVFDADGDIFGTTTEGGGSQNFGTCGTVFELVAPVGTGSYTEKILWSFTGTNNGCYPLMPLILDNAGNFYGTTQNTVVNGGFGVAYTLGHTTAITLTSSPNPSNTGQSVFLTATVTSSGGTPPNGETISFFNGSALLGTAPLSGGTASKGGTASLTTSFLQGGTFTITASYAGDANFSAATSPALLQAVINTSKSATSTTISSSLNPSVSGQAVTFTATVISTGGTPPNGELITFYNGSNILGKASMSGGGAAMTKSSLPSGISTISAAYGGDANFTGSTSPGLKQVVDTQSQSPTATTLTSSLNPSIYGQKVTWTATVTTSGKTTPTGRVNFNWGYSIGTATLNASGVATLTKSGLNADPYPLIAVYTGDANNGPSASPILNQVVQQTTSAAALSSSLNPSASGQAVTFTATITSPTVMPTGPVTFAVGNTVLGTAQLSGGKAKFTISTLAVGSTKVTATYYGNSNIAKSSASVTQTVK